MEATITIKYSLVPFRASFYAFNSGFYRYNWNKHDLKALISTRCSSYVRYSVTIVFF